MNKEKLEKPSTRAYKFAGQIIKLVQALPNKRVYWVMGDQVLRSGTSVGANLAEAKYSSSKKEFIRYYKIALKSGNETSYWLSLLKDHTDVNKEKVEELIKESQELVKILSSSIMTMKNNNS